MIILEDHTIIMLKAILTKAAEDSGLIDINNSIINYNQETGIIEWVVKIKDNDIDY